MSDIYIFDFIKFSWIVLCFLIALGSYRFCCAKRDWAFLTAGMAFTLAADFFLVLFDNQPVGVPVFCFAHAAHFLRVTPKKYAFIPLAAAAVAVPVYVVFGFLPAAAGLYAGLFICNLTANIRNLPRNINRMPRLNRVLTLAGMVLFVLCDVNVVLFNLPHYLPCPAWLARMGYLLIWVFYAPAQLLLAVSAVRFNKNETKKG